MTRQSGRPADESGRLERKYELMIFWMRTMYGMSGSITKQR